MNGCSISDGSRLHPTVTAMVRTLCLEGQSVEQIAQRTGFTTKRVHVEMSKLRKRDADFAARIPARRLRSHPTVTAMVRWLCLEGQTVEQIAQRTGFTKQRVHVEMSKLRKRDAGFAAQFPTRQLRPHAMAEREAKITELAASGMTRAQVAAQLGLATKTVALIARLAAERGRPMAFGRANATPPRLQIKHDVAKRLNAMAKDGDGMRLARRLVSILSREPVLVRNLLEDA